MTVAEMHTSFKILLDKLDSLNYANISPEQIDFILNKEQDRFVKHRYDGMQARSIGMEESQKRSDDLRNITISASLTPLAASSDNKKNGRFVDLPSSSGEEYWFAIQEEANVVRIACPEKRVSSGDIVENQVYLVFNDSITYDGVTVNPGEYFDGNAGVTTYTGNGIVVVGVLERAEVKPTTHDKYNKIENDPFNKPVVDDSNKQLRRLQLGGRMEILLPDATALDTYILRYIRRPRRISLSSSIDCELAEHTHQEIVDMAVSSTLESIESPRYRSHLNELGKLE